MWARSIKQLALNVSPHNRSLDSLIYEEYPAISCPLVKIVGPSRNFVIFGGDGEIHRAIQFQFRIQYRTSAGIIQIENRSYRPWIARYLDSTIVAGHISRTDFNRAERGRVSRILRESGEMTTTVGRGVHVYSGVVFKKRALLAIARLSR